jgi:hypothetical protein
MARVGEPKQDPLRIDRLITRHILLVIWRGLALQGEYALASLINLYSFVPIKSRSCIRIHNAHSARFQPQDAFVLRECKWNQGSAASRRLKKRGF